MVSTQQTLLSNSSSFRSICQISIARICDGHNVRTEKLTTGSTEVDVVTREVVDCRIGKHCVILELRLTERGAIRGNDEQLAFALAERLNGTVNTETVFATLDNELESGVDVLCLLLALLRHHLLLLLETFGS